jgi:peptide/nickel transport system permease protein
VRGDFGVSYQFRVPVSTLIAERIPATIELTAISLLLAIMLGVPAGVMAAVRPDTWPSRIAMGVSLTGVSLPTFLIGILMIFTFSATLHWLPAFGRGDVVRIGNWSTGLLTATGLKSIIMPAATLALYQITLIVRLVRSEMISVLRRPHVIAARARGLSARSVYFHHALRSALSPLLPVTAVQIGTVAAFAVVTETVFQWPGLGSLFVKAVQTADVPVMTSYLVFAAAIFATTNLVADLLQMAFDPRACDNVLGRA